MPQEAITLKKIAISSQIAEYWENEPINIIVWKGNRWTWQRAYRCGQKQHLMRSKKCQSYFWQAVVAA